jgi:hypothetical protein
MRKNQFTRAAAAALAGTLLTFALASPAGPALAADNGRAPIDPSFDVLLKKSIFSRDRSRGTGAPASTAPAAGAARVLSPEQSVAFRGVLCPDEEYVAFMENIQTGQISIVKAGDEIGRGRVAAITLDTLAYDAGGKVHQIRLGQDLTGETAASSGGGTGGSTTAPSVAGATAGSGTGAGATGTPAPDSNPAAASMIEKMRQRRLQEGGR